LVVDDAACFREAARELLERRGYVVACEAECAASALRALEQFAPDAVLLDVNLPDANGCDLAAELTGADPTLAILLVSAHPLDPQLARNSGARGFVPKSQLGMTDFTRFWPTP